jgi:hypothetical protein
MARLKNLISQYANQWFAFAFLALFAFFVSTLAFIHQDFHSTIRIFKHHLFGAICA